MTYYNEIIHYGFQQRWTSKSKSKSHEIYARESRLIEVCFKLENLIFGSRLVVTKGTLQYIKLCKLGPSRTTFKVAEE